jgi:hypothetical protein
MRPVRMLALPAIYCVLVGSIGCGKSPDLAKKEQPIQQATAVQPQDDDSSLMFDMAPSIDASGPANSKTYDCVYQAGGKTARFRVQFIQGAPFGDKDQFVSAEDKFLAVAGSDNTALLQNLKKVLEAKHLPTKTPRVSELAFDAAVLGLHQTRDPSGSFGDNPPGDWIATKIFLPKDGDDGEVFFNFNPVLGKGEFSLKDPDYGDYVLEAFSKVL